VNVRGVVRGAWPGESTRSRPWARPLNPAWRKVRDHLIPIGRSKNTGFTSSDKSKVSHVSARSSRCNRAPDFPAKTFQPTTWSSG